MFIESGYILIKRLELGLYTIQEILVLRESSGIMRIGETQGGLLRALGRPSLHF